MAPDWALPVVFEMVHPIRCLDQRRPLSDSGISKPHPIGCSAIGDLLRHPDRIEIHRVDLDRAGDVLEMAWAKPLESEGQLLEQMVMRLARDVDPAGLGDGLEPGGDVHAVTIDVITVDNDIAKIDADAKSGAFRLFIPRCTSTAQRRASTTLGNSIRIPSPVVLTTRPRCSAMFGSISSRRQALSAARVPSSSAPIR